MGFLLILQISVLLLYYQPSTRAEASGGNSPAHVDTCLWIRNNWFITIYNLAYFS